MNGLQTGGLHLLLACLPPLTAGILLWRRTAPGWAGLGALVIGMAVLPAFDPSPAALGEAVAGIAPVAIEVLIIMYGGIVLFAVLRSAGLHQALGRWVASLAPDRPLGVLLVALGVTPFLESVTGFGVGLIMSVPILREMGLSSRQATLVAMLGLVIVPWGALGPGTLVAAELTGVDLDALGVASARYSLPVFLACGFAALAGIEGTRGALARAADVALAAGSLWLGVWGANLVLGTPPAGAGGSAIAAAVVVARATWGRRRSSLAAGGLTAAAADPSTGPSIGRALVPYAVLLGTLLAARLVVAMTGLPDPAGRWLRSPALWLPVTAVITLYIGVAARRGSAARDAATWAYHRWKGVAAATLLFLVLGTLMTESGMAAVLAAGATGIGGAYAALAPWIGGLGGFLTGTNTGANAMFATAQAVAAARLDLPVLELVAIQNVAASLATMLAGPRVALVRSLLDPGEPWQDLIRLALVVNLVILCAWSVWLGLNLA